VPILITGERGTGKSLLAALIHRCSPRRTAPFVTVCCAALTEHRLESTLLEHLNGAIVRPNDGRARAEVSGGTLFFDEIGNVPANCQMKLSYYLEARSECLVVDGRRELDARVIAATRLEPEGEVESGRLRDKLLLQLAVVTIALPPLRERKEDLPKLCEHFLAQLATRHARDAVELTAEAEQMLARYDWPGNVRELQSVLERAIVLTDGCRIGAEDLSAVCTALTRGGPGTQRRPAPADRDLGAA
jgi:DNA-binding NtrC family response regulator